MSKFTVIKIEDMNIAVHFEDFYILTSNSMSKVHDHVNYEVLYIPYGLTEYVADGEKYILSGNSILLIPPNVLHQQSAVPEDSLRFAFSFTLSKNPHSTTGMYKKCNKLLKEFLFKPTLLKADLCEFEELRKCFVTSGNTSSLLPDFTSAMTESYLTVIILKIFSELAKNAPDGKLLESPTNIDKPTDPKAVEISDYINSCYNTNPSIHALAKSLYLSVRQTERLIRKHMNTSFSELLNRQRIKIAKHLIEDSIESKNTISYASIASTTGFSNYHTFLKQFKIYTGMSPCSYRKSLTSKK